jgi:PRTRC genetic system ThiF family protein
MTRIWNYLKAPYKKLTFSVVGAGGTGSEFLVALAKIAVAYGKLRNIGIHVIVIDYDIVSDANISKQKFSQSEIGMNKATALVSKINRTYGLDWEASTESFMGYHRQTGVMSNFLVSCVDNVKARQNIQKYMDRYQKRTMNHAVFNDDVWYKNFFWMDIGNSKNSGQVVIGSSNTPSVIEMYPDLTDDGDDTPSCSLPEALNKQDLFVNVFAANLAAKLIWQILTEYRLPCSALFFNLTDFNIKTIPVTDESTANIRNARRGKRVRRNKQGIS